MPHSLPLLLIALGVVFSVVIGIRSVRSVRRFRAVKAQVDARLADRAGLLRARSAALGVALAQRRGNRGGSPVRDGHVADSESDA